MRKSKFTAEQIAYCVTQAQAGVPIGELCRKYGISQQTFYRWKSKYGDLTPSEVKEMQQLRDENARLCGVTKPLPL